MNLTDIKKIYFLGIGGIGMSALARFFASRGITIYGYDKTPSSLTNILEQEGMCIHYEENPELIPHDVDMVIYTPAIPKDNKEFIHFNTLGIPMCKRAQVLGQITRQMKTIAVAGTHGKTTISSMIAYLLDHSSVECNAFLGGLASNYNSNLILSQKSDWVVVEADEYDRSFLQLHPDITVVSSVEADHLDIYGNSDNLKMSFAEFTSQTKANGHIFQHADVDIQGTKTYRTYGLNRHQATIYSHHVRHEKNKIYFDFVMHDYRINDLCMTYPGLHNVENATVAIAVALTCGVTEQEIRDALVHFSGVKRRFEVKLKNDHFVYMDDYAHHPSEIRTCILSVKAMYPGKKITGVFQPHLYTRTRDFADEFARVLSLLDQVVLLDIYPARELPIEGVTSKMLLKKITITDKILSPKESLVDTLLALKPEVLITMGAGDIDRLVEPIQTAFSKQI